MSALDPQLEKIIKSISTENNLFLQSTTLEAGEPARLEVVVDSQTDEPITLDQISDVSNALSQELDEHDVIDGEYLLEVLSPGADQPLTEDRHFNRAVDKIVLIETEDKNYRGILTAVSDTDITLEAKPKMVKGKAPKKNEQGTVTIDRDSITHVVIELPS